MNNDGFTKLFSSIVTSSLWSEDDKTRILWITILAITDKDGFCAASIPGLSAMARLPVKDVQDSLIKLEGPDTFSRTEAYEGRRLKKVEGGWLVINYRLYRDRERAERRREYMKELMKCKRSKDANTANNMLTGANLSASVSSSVSSSSSLEDRSVREETTFDQFWAAYPRKIGKKAALKAWNMAKDLPDITVILTAITAQKASTQWLKDGGQFIPHPATWLNQGRWHDEVKQRRIYE